MNCCRRSLALTVYFLLAPHCAWTTEPEVGPKDLPRIAPTEPDKALATFQIKKGFRIEQVAAEPLVVDPIAMSFDENGRLFVVEMRDYSERRNETPHLGRIQMLEDTDGDGHFDKSTVYVDNLPWPTAVFCYGGGIFVGATPDILYCKDTNGDGVADVREAVFTGFASDYAPYQTNRLNVQALFNSFNWGLDNRIHGATSLSGGKVRLMESPFTREWIRPASAGSQPSTLNSPTDLRGRDFSFDPRTLDFRAESGGGQHGLSFNSAGRKFVCSNSSHIQTLMYEERYAARNPYYAMPRALVDIAADGPAAEVFRISPDEPWRVIRTQWRVAGLAPGPIEGGGRPSGYFTGATGLTIYRGDAFPQDYRDNAFVADCGSNLVHRKKLYPDESGVELIARRPDDEQKVEFLASTDNWFRPVQFANAPDGTLYLADMYREVIEHPWSLPDSIKKHLDLNSGNDRGRIYRVVPDGFKQPILPQLDKAGTKELVTLLGSPNGWHRDTAARLLYERQDKAAVPQLEQLLVESKMSMAKVHALSVLKGIAALKEDHLLVALADPAEVVRCHAVRVSEDLVLPATNRVEHRLRSLADDPSPLVRYQLAFVLGTGFHGQEKADTLAELARHDAKSLWSRAAILSSVDREAVQVFYRLVSDVEFRNTGSGQLCLRELVAVIAARKDAGAVAAVLDLAGRWPEPGLAFGLVGALGEGLQRAGSSLAHADAGGKLTAVVARAKAASTDTTAAETVRIQAIRLLGIIADQDSRVVLLSLVETNQSDAVRSAALGGLGHIGDPGIANELLNRWSGLTPGLRSEALPLLLTRVERTKVLLAAVERGEVQRADFSAAQLQTLRTHSDEAIRQQTLKLFGEPPAARRQAIISAFFAALNLQGDAGRGKTIYFERCASCHRLGGQGFALGPDLVTVKTSGKESLLVNILDPNRQVAPNYLNYTVETKDGQTLSGLIANESTASVTLRGPNGIENVVLRSNIGGLQSQGQSVMPEGLEAGLNPENFADLLEYLVTARE